MAAWRSWVDLAGKGFKSTSSPHPFESGTSSARNFAEPYLAFVRAIQQLLQQGGDADFARRFGDTLRTAAQQGTGPAGNEEFLNVFLRTAPSALLSAFPDANAGAAWRQWSNTLSGWARELLALPAIGPQREWLELLKAFQRALLVEAEKRAAVDEHYRLAIRAALHGFADYLKDDGGPPITSVRALYDAWIDQAEAAYAERVMGDDFSRDFAAWVNAGSEMRLALRALGGRLSALFDAPGRDEINVLIERQQAMQRELAALRAERHALSAQIPPASVISPAAASLPAGQSPEPADIAPLRAPRRASKAPAASPAKVASDTPVKRTRVSAPKAPKNKPAARGEFDIAHILDAGK